jgi:diketogulonate reductase-like aldo/keto reductase
MDRRVVLQGMASVAAATMLPASGLAVEAPARRRRIPSTGAEIPAVGIGSWITFNVGSDPVLLERSTGVIAAFLEEGGGVIDSSPMYGSSQATIGYALAQLDAADSVFSADKVWTSAVDAPGQLAETGARWGTSRFDLLQVHNLIDWQANLELLFALKEAGRLGHVGITTSHGRRHGELERIMASQPVDFVQLTYNLADREAEARLLPLAQEKGIAVIVNRPFRRGSLIRDVGREPLPAMSAELGAESWAQVLLKFILGHPATTCVIPATTRVDHVRENKSVVRGPLPDAAMRRELAAYFDDL